MSRAGIRSLSVLVVAGTLVGAGVDAQIYVDQNATALPHDGSSWCNAYLTVHEALAVAVFGDAILVADGLYTPDTTGLRDPREATFELVSGTVLQGGYAGCGAPNPDARDVVANLTVLSGDLNGDDASDIRPGKNWTMPTRYKLLQQV